MSSFGPPGQPANPRVPTPPQGEPIGRYSSYLQAQRAVDFLSDNRFPVHLVTIVGTGLQMVERVMGRLTYPKVALSGLGSGAYFGAFVGFALAAFAQASLQSVLALVALGAGFGVLYGVIAYAMTRGRRDFTSTSQIVATEYIVLCLAERAGEAREMLSRLPGGSGLGVPAAPGPWAPPPVPGAPATTPPPGAPGPAAGPSAPHSPYGAPPVPGEVPFDGPAPETLAPSGPTYGEIMERRRREERARLDAEADAAARRTTADEADD